MQKIKYGVDNIFDYLPDSITTVNVILDSINFKLQEFPKNVENIVKNLNNEHFYSDDFFDIDTCKVLTEKEIHNQYNLKIV
jgi:hypothetical protein